MDHFLEART
jgi:hypothetical protein